MTELKTPPHNIEAEQSLLGAVFVNNRIVLDIEFISPSDFYRPDHAAIFSEMFKLAMSRKPIDAVSLVDSLNDSGQLENAGGVEYVVGLADSPSSVNALHHAKIIKDKAVKRQMISAASQIADIGYNGGEAQSCIDEAQKLVMGLSTEKPTDVTKVASIVGSAISDIEHRGQHGFTGLKTGLKDLDKKILGLENQDLIVVAGRPSMGKTSFAGNIIESVVEKGGFVIEYSLEMPKEQLTKRHFASMGKVDFTNIRNGKLSADEWDSVHKAAVKLAEKDYYIDDTPSLSSTRILSRARKLAQKVGKSPDLIVIDYLQLINDAKDENETQRISEISRNIKLAARELDCPIILLSQLNRNLENRPNKRPVMSDLRSSGSIEQDADVIIFLYRDEVYDEDSEHKGVAEIIVSKQRNGPIGTVYSSFIGKYCRFENFTPGYTPKPLKETKIKGFSYLDEYRETA